MRLAPALGLLVVLAGLVVTAPRPAQAHGAPHTLAGALLAAQPAPTPAVTPVPTSGPSGLTLDRFALGFGLVVVGTFGAAFMVLAMRRLRRSMNDPPLKSDRNRRT